MTVKRYIRSIGVGLLGIVGAWGTFNVIQQDQVRVVDGIVFIFLLFALTWIGAWYFIKKDHIDLGSKQLAQTGLVAVVASVFRFLLLALLPDSRSGLTDSLLLAVAAGAVASFVILWIEGQKLQASDSETSVNRVTWTFDKLSDDEKDVEIKYERIQERTNRSDEEKYGWEREWFEPYPGTEGVQEACVRVAEEENDVFSGDQTRGNKLPLMALDGFVIRLDKQSHDAKKGWLKRGETKWFKIEATLRVPVSYWDYSIGLAETELSQKPQFTMNDKTGKLALVLASSGNQPDLNFDKKGERKRDIVQLTGRRKGRLRAQALWFHKDNLTENTERLINARFGPPNA